ncbi:MAG: hypothetical protein M3291_09090 [Actinomycetota bacterium]|nr:hypothetical protein [Actinomycetota bacterium]
MAVLVEEAAGSGRLAHLLQAPNTNVVVLNQRAALKVGVRCAASGASDVVDVSVLVRARDRGQPVVTSEPGDLLAIDPDLRLLAL